MPGSRRLLGDDHPDTLSSPSNLAADLTALGEHQGARVTVPVFRDRRAARQPPQLHCHLPGPRAPALADAQTRRSAPPRARAAPTGTAPWAARHAPISDIMRLTSPIQRAGGAHSTQKS